MAWTTGVGGLGVGDVGAGETELGEGGHLEETFGAAAFGVGLGDDKLELLLRLEFDSCPADVFCSKTALGSMLRCLIRAWASLFRCLRNISLRIRRSSSSVSLSCFCFNHLAFSCSSWELLSAFSSAWRSSEILLIRASTCCSLARQPSN